VAKEPSTQQKTFRSDVFRNLDKRLTDFDGPAFDEARSQNQSFWDSYNRINEVESARARLAYLVEALSPLPLEALSDAQAKRIGEHLNNAVSSLGRLCRVYPQQDPQQISNWVDGLKNEVDQLTDAAAPMIPFLIHVQGSFASLLKNVATEAKNVALNATAIVQKAQEQANALDENAKRILETATNTATDNAVMVHFDAFDKQATADRISSRWWLGFAGLFAVLSVLAAYLLFPGVHLPWLSTPTSTDTVQVIHALAGRFGLLGVLISAAFWCGGNYRTAARQRITNLHRANALRTFRAFRDAAVDQKIKDAVLLEATHAVFAHVPIDAKDNTGEGGLQPYSVTLLRSGSS
jgi:hypothetical protein